jgi:hypothetical protein
MCPKKKCVYSPYSRTITALLCLLVAQAESAPFSGKSPMDAIELLTAFSGESAKQYESFFRFSEEARMIFRGSQNRRCRDPRRRNGEHDGQVFRQ